MNEKEVLEIIEWVTRGYPSVFRRFIKLDPKVTQYYWIPAHSRMCRFVFAKIGYFDSAESVLCRPSGRFICIVN